MSRSEWWIGICCVALAAPAGASVIHVDDDALPGGSGQSWETAFTFLQDALAVAQSGDEIRLAGGTYYPDRDAAHPTGAGNRNTSFVLVSGVALCGGYAGLSVPSDPDQRNVVLYASTLSGNINSQSSSTDDSFRVVAAAGTVAGTVLDGVTIERGYGGYSSLREGVGLRLANGVLRLRACVIRNNNGGTQSVGQVGGCGGGLYCSQSDVELIGCVFEDNVAQKGGDGPAIVAPAGGNVGGLYACNSSFVRAVQCRFDSNRAGPGGTGSMGGAGGPGGHGGAVGLATGADGEFVNCVFGGNHAGDGGGGSSAYGQGGDGGDGGTLHLADSSGLTMVNCLIAGNWAGSGARGDGQDAPAGDGGNGGGLLVATPNVRLFSCTIVDNSAGAGGAAYGGAIPGLQGHGGALYCGDAAPVFRNCVLWNGSPDLIIGFPDISYSAVEVGWPGLGNISLDPQFVDADGPDNDPSTWADNDYHLATGSPCIDAGDNVNPPRDVLDLDGDACTTEPIPVDLSGWARYVDDSDTPDTGHGAAPLVDMGTYEYPDFSAPPAGGPCAGDTNCDGVIDFDDVNPFVLSLTDPVAYAQAFPECFVLAADINHDGVPSFDDINAFVALLSE